MIQTVRNPFNVTKAVDFSDREIMETWVDLPGADSLVKLADPTSPMPMLLLGGKGSGRTHLMRYFSYPVQKLRHERDLITGLKNEGYIGVYMRCGGLNAGRFTGKGQEEDRWNAIFSYYMDLWLGQVTLSTISDALDLVGKSRASETIICKQVLGLFHTSDFGGADTIAALINLFHALQRDVDAAVNNAALTGRLDVRIRATRGELVFGIPRIIAKQEDMFGDIQFLYLIDEFENLTQDQQIYVNTLVREKEPPCSFKIGARLYGIRSQRTYSAGEENREGSEYESVYLDRTHLDDPHRYERFARRLIARRLLAPDSQGVNGHVVEEAGNALDAFFDDLKRDSFLFEETRYVLNKYRDTERPYFRRLRAQLEMALPRHDGVAAKDEPTQVVRLLAVPEYPLLEKLNLLLFYQDWYERRDHPNGKKDLVAVAGAIAAGCRSYLADPNAQGRHRQVMGHFRWDLFAQLLRETDQKQRYFGLRTFIAMSSGLPRNLLVILKHIHKWAAFNGEKAFRDGPISRDAQRRGLLEAANWFFEDAQVIGEHGAEVQDAVRRLAELFRALRFSDKPVESSLIAFSVDLTSVTAASARTIHLAEQWSLLVRVSGGQRDRNSARIDEKYQLNSMLCPRWDLPVYRRGATVLAPSEVNAIFDENYHREFEAIMNSRLSRMIAPFRVRDRGQSSLPGLDD